MFRFDSKAQSGDWADLAPAVGITAVALHAAWAVHDGDVGNFNSAPPVPEPGTYALMLAGVAAVGAAARRGKG